MKWRMENVLKLIGLYRQFECLWNYKSSAYKRADLKKNAWKEISKEFDASEQEIKKKIKYLRSAYINEKKKVNSRKSGSAQDSAYESHLFYFTEMSFLDSVVVLRTTSSNLKQRTLEVASEAEEAVEIDPDEQNLIEPSISLTRSQHHSSTTSLTSASSMPLVSSLSSSSVLQSSSSSSLSLSSASSTSSMPLLTSSRQSMKSKRKKNKFDRAIESIVASATTVEEENVFTSFGKTIALQLQQMSLRDATQTMSDIHLLVTQKLLKTIDVENVIEENMEDDYVYDYYYLFFYFIPLKCNISICYTVFSFVFANFACIYNCRSAVLLMLSLFLGALVGRFALGLGDEPVFATENCAICNRHVQLNRMSQF